MRPLVLALVLAGCVASVGDDYPIKPNVQGGSVVTGVHVVMPVDAGIPPLDVGLPPLDARPDAPPPADAE